MGILLYYAINLSVILVNVFGAKSFNKVYRREHALIALRFSVFLELGSIKYMIDEIQ